MKERQKLIKASEIGEYLFCARAWRLRIEGYSPTRGQAAREAGTAWHVRHGQTTRRARRLQRVAALAGLAAIVVATLLFLLWWWK